MNCETPLSRRDNVLTEMFGADYLAPYDDADLAIAILKGNNDVIRNTLIANINHLMQSNRIAIEVPRQCGKSKFLAEIHRNDYLHTIYITHSLQMMRHTLPEARSNFLHSSNKHSFQFAATQVEHAAYKGHILAETDVVLFDDVMPEDIIKCMYYMECRYVDLSQVLIIILGTIDYSELRIRDLQIVNAD